MGLEAGEASRYLQGKTSSKTLIPQRMIEHHGLGPRGKSLYASSTLSLTARFALCNGKGSARIQVLSFFVSL